MDQLFLLYGHSVKQIEPNADYPILLPRTPIEDLAQRVPYLHAALRARADGLVILPRRFFRRGQEIEEKDIPFIIDWADLLWRTEYALNLYGAAYWYKARDREGVRWVRWLDPTTVNPLVDHKRGLYGFSRTVITNEIYHLDKKGLSRDLVYFWLPGLRETEPGCYIDAVREAAEALHNIDKYTNMFFHYGGMPITLLVVPPATSETERERLETKFSAFARGLRNAFRPIAVRSQIDVKTVGVSPAHLDMAELINSKRDAILAALGVPISLIVGTSVNYATATQEIKNFITHTLGPRATFIASVVNKQLLSEYDITLVLDYEALPAMREDERQAAFAFQQYVTAGLSPRQAASLLGIPYPEEENAPKPISEAIATELKRWHIKARNAWQKNAKADVEFTTQVIHEEAQKAIREALRHVSSPHDIDAIFAAAPHICHGSTWFSI